MVLKSTVVLYIFLFKHILLVLTNFGDNLSTLNCEFTQPDITE